MDVRQLKYFVAIVDASSISKAAQALYVAQPSLSQQISGLEEELKVKLLLRSSHGVKPTEAGRALYKHARQLMRQMEQIRVDVREGSGSETGTVAIGFPTTVAWVLARPLFSYVRRKYPGIKLQIFESISGYITELLANGRLDLAILFRDVESSGASQIPLFKEDLYLVGDAGVAFSEGASVCTLDQLASIPLALPSTTSGLRKLIEKTFSREDVMLNVVGEVDSLSTLIAIAESGDAGTILPLSALSGRDTATAPVARKLEPGIRRTASLCWSDVLPSDSATIAVRQAVVDLVAELHRDGRWPGIELL
ncbi:LysR substrate-binding domain-containing protein [Paraburkholderia hospita]|uniref:LysR substrate-binding domain-containing protein n=1 Tax=Paraburkholderia hospita TaxID=169430 RepID=UPI000271934A|nr:LysR substrate-binding domain-containing protein [Paraburkholderia hospita]EUC20691.1 transcriptional regulator, LysR family [Burkholderia sp. BT03]SKC45425.1 DNA-binding transcriptional regulator, LysR family [Paraburkholderia hospita]SKD04292.1 DNA-binding transcriptional regulator, LysR family [Paraburkholderia hospita]